MIQQYKERIDRAIEGALPSFGAKTRLRDAIEYALLNGGKRLRPALVLMVGEAIGNNDVMDSALAVEFFHTASLIADDLPCMDNDLLRRGQPTLHTSFDEATALLASYALIAAGYEQIRLNGLKLRSPTVLFLALENATANTGIHGTTGGQYLDLFSDSVEEPKDILRKKTAALFEISFVFGWLFGAGEPKHLDSVKKISQHFGTAFQISDDLIDLEQDQTKFNYAALVGATQAREELAEELMALRRKLKDIGIDSPQLKALVLSIEMRAQAVCATSFS